MSPTANHAIAGRFFRAIAEYTYDWESWIDADGRLRWVNVAVERIAGYTVKECMALPRYPLDLVHPDDREQMQEVIRSAALGSSGNDVEFRVLRKNGSVRWAAVSWQSFEDDDGRRLGYRTSVRDIEERKEMEAHLRVLQQRAEQADRAKTQLLANVSHELRTPAHCIEGFAEMLLEGELTREQARYVAIVKDQASVLLRQVDDLLDMAALESGAVRLEVEPFPLELALESAVAPLLPTAERKGLALRVEPTAGSPAWWLGDRGRLTQVVRNLVENAIKYTEKGSITVRARVAVDGGDQGLCFEVFDTGIGIPADRLASLTQPFVQVDDSNARLQGGAGLGLSICERLVRAMGGSLDIVSELGRGTSVTVRLPLSPTQPPDVAISDAEESLAAPLPVSSLRVLVADDTDASRELLCEQLDRVGCRALSASSGREALDIIEHTRPELILLDIQMPGLDGHEVASCIRARTDGSYRPRIVGVTASTLVREMGAAERGPFDRMLTRPVTRAHLLEVLGMTSADSSRPPRMPAPAGDAMPAPAGGAMPALADPRIDSEVVEDLRSVTDATERTMLDRYLERVGSALPGLLSSLGGHIEAGRRDEMERVAHQVLGLMQMIGAREAARVAKELAEGDGERDLAALLVELEQCFGSAVAALT